MYEEDCIWNLSSTCACENDKYLVSIIGNSIVTWDEIIKVVAKSYKHPRKTTPINLNEKRQPVKWKISVFYFALWLITISLFIIISTHYYYYY